MLDARSYKMLTSFDLVGLLSLIQTYCHCPGLPREERRDFDFAFSPEKVCQRPHPHILSRLAPGYTLGTNGSWSCMVPDSLEDRPRSYRGHSAESWSRCRFAPGPCWRVCNANPHHRPPSLELARGIALQVPGPVSENWFRLFLHVRQCERAPHRMGGGGCVHP